jgi:hypothetical protein
MRRWTALSVVAQEESFPGDVEQSSAVPEFVENAIDVFRFDQDDVAVVFGVVSAAGV